MKKKQQHLLIWILQQSNEGRKKLGLEPTTLEHNGFLAIFPCYVDNLFCVLCRIGNIIARFVISSALE